MSRVGNQTKNLHYIFRVFFFFFFKLCTKHDRDHFSTRRITKSRTYLVHKVKENMSRSLLFNYFYVKNYDKYGLLVQLFFFYMRPISTFLVQLLPRYSSFRIGGCPISFQHNTGDVLDPVYSKPKESLGIVATRCLANQ